MPGRTVVVALSARISGFTEGMRAASASATSFGRSAAAAGAAAESGSTKATVGAERTAAATAKSAAASVKAEEASRKSALAQRRLADAAGANRIALARVADAEARLAKAQNAGAEGSAREVAATESLEKARRAQVVTAGRLASAEDRLTAISAKPSFLSSVTKNKDSLDKVARGFAVVGAAAALGFGLAVHSASEFDQAIADVSASGQYSKQELEKLAHTAVTTGASFGASGIDAAHGEEALLKAGVGVTDVINGGLKGALLLASAGQIDVGQAAEIAASAMTQFGLKGDQVTHVADLLAASADKAQGNVTDMSKALEYVGPVASQSGVSIEQTVGAITLLAKNGILGEKAGTGLRGVLSSLEAPSAKAAKVMAGLGINVYDAQGKFIGFNGAAGQLEDALGGLTQAQQNQALGQIFGNAQLTAATVLFKAGAAGVDASTHSIEINGFATQSAAKKNDSLQGSLRKLKAEATNLFISLGESKTGALKGITDDVTKLIHSFDSLTPKTKSTILTITGLVAAGALGAAGLIKIVTAITAAKTALSELVLASKLGGLKNLGGDAEGAASKFGKLKGAVGPAVIGILAYSAAVSGLLKASDGPALVASVQDTTSALLKLGKAAPSATNSLDGLFQKVGDRGKVVSLTGDVSNLGDAFATTFHPGLALKIAGVGESFVTLGGSLGRTNADKVAAQFKQLDTSLVDLASSNPEAAASAFKQIAAMRGQKVSVEQLLTKFPEYKAALVDTANQLGVTSLSAKDYAGWMAGTVPPTIAAAIAAKKLADAAGGTIPNLKALSGAIDFLKGPPALAGAQLKALSQSIFGEGDAVQSGVATHSAYAAAIDDTSAALKKNKDYTNKAGTALSDNTAKGRENIDALGSLSSAGKAYVQSLITQGASTKKVAAATGEVRSQFVKAAEGAGLNASAAKKLADSYGLIPNEVTVKINAFGLALQNQQVQSFAERIKQLPKTAQAKIIATYDSKGAKAALAELNTIEHKTAKPRILTQSDAKRVASSASSFLGAIRDGKPSIKTQSDTKRIAGQATSFLRSIKDVDPKVLTRNDLRAAASARAYIANTKGKAVTIAVGQRGASAAQAAINSVHGKSVTIYTTEKHTVSNKITNSISTVHTKAAGGYITGPGTATSDSIPARLSAGEFVLRAAAVRAIGVSELHRFNALGGPQQAFAAGGEVQRYASGGPVIDRSALVSNVAAGRLAPTAAPSIDVVALQAAVRDGAREGAQEGARQGIQAHLSTLDPRQEAALVRRANRFEMSRGTGR